MTKKRQLTAEQKARKLEWNRAYNNKMRHVPGWLEHRVAMTRRWRNKPEVKERYNAYNRERYKEKIQDPEWAEKEKIRKRTYDRKRRAVDPAYVERKAQLAREYKERVRQDPIKAAKAKQKAKEYRVRRRMQDPKWAEKERQRTEEYFASREPQALTEDARTLRNKKALAYYYRMKAKPGWSEARNERRRIWGKEPENREKLRAKSRAYYQRKRGDPEWRKRRRLQKLASARRKRALKEMPVEQVAKTKDSSKPLNANQMYTISQVRAWFQKEKERKNKDKMYM